MKKKVQNSSKCGNQSCPFLGVKDPKPCNVHAWSEGPFSWENLAVAPLFLDETEARRAENIFFKPPPSPPPLSQGLDDRAPLIWRSGSTPALSRLYQSLKGKNIIIMHACLSLPGKRTYTMLARVQQSKETRSYDFKIKYWDDFDTRLEWLKNSSKHSNVSQQDWSANLSLEF